MKFIRLLPERQRTNAAGLIAALKSTFDNANEEGSREVRAHGAMLELKQRRDELPAKYVRRARRIADHINPKFDNLMVIKFRDGLRSRSLKSHLSIRDSTGKSSVELIYKRFTDLDRFEQKNRSDPFDSDSSDSSSESESDTDATAKKKRKREFRHPASNQMTSPHCPLKMRSSKRKR